MDGCGKKDDKCRCQDDDHFDGLVINLMRASRFPFPVANKTRYWSLSETIQPPALIES